MEQKIKIALIGAGNIAKTHIRAYKSVPEVEIAAICDINKEVLEATAEEYGIEKKYLSVDELLENEKELDAADVCVWNCNHAKCAIAALNAGLHVLCEKPMAYSVSEAEEMKACAEKNGKILMIGFVSRFSPGAKILKDYIDAGYLGNIYYAKTQYIRRHGNPGGWFSDKSRSGGGPVIDVGVHDIDRARYLMGLPKPVSVYAAAVDNLGDRRDLKNDVSYKPKDATDNDICDVEDFATAMIRFDNGAVIQVETSFDINLPTQYGMTLCGDKGGMKESDTEPVLYTNLNGFMTNVNIDTSCYKEGKSEFEGEMRHFADCILGKCECIPTAEDGLIIMKIVEAIYESARTGHEVIIK